MLLVYEVRSSNPRFEGLRPQPARRTPGRLPGGHGHMTFTSYQRLLVQHGLIIMLLGLIVAFVLMVIVVVMLRNLPPASDTAGDTK